MTDRAILVEEKVRARYNEKADVYPQLYEGPSWLAHFYRTRMERVCELLRDGNGSRILEVGCGPAMLAQTLASRGYDYHGVDISEKMISGCKERWNRLAGAHFSVGTIRQLHVPDAAFDVVLGLGVLEYVVDKRAAVREVARVLRRGGRLIVSGNNKWSPRNLWHRWVSRQAGQDEGATVKAFHSEEEYRAMLQPTVFAVQQVLYFDFSLLPTFLANCFPGVAHSISHKLDGLRRTALRRLGNGFLVEARKRRTTDMGSRE